MTRREILTEWIKIRHAGQLIKVSGEPYFEHLLSVAQMAVKVMPLGYEIGLSHDLLEKTQTSDAEFYQALISFGYNHEESQSILLTVIELTDVYTKAAYPDLKKMTRKEKEEERLIAISPGAQTVKYADLIYNIKWMLKFDTKHAKGYLKRKRRLLQLMNLGDFELLNNANKLLANSLQST